MRLEHPERSPRPSEEKPEEGTWPPNVPKQPSSCAASQRNCAEAPLSHHACLGTAFTRATQGSPSLSTQGRQGLWVLPAPFGGRSVGRNAGCLGASRLQVHTSHQNNPPAPQPAPLHPHEETRPPAHREGGILFLAFDGKHLLHPTGVLPRMDWKRVGRKAELCAHNLAWR